MKEYLSAVDWQKMYEFVIECGKEHDPYHFTEVIVHGLMQFCRFDGAVVMFLDGNRNIVDNYLYRFDPKWLHIFTEYYSKMDLGDFNINQDVTESPVDPFVQAINWEDYATMDFVIDYVKANRLSWSLAFLLFDLNGQPRSVFSLDYKNGHKPLPEEVEYLNILVPALNNLHKNFFVALPGGTRYNSSVWQSANLTDRETEIVELICQGISPANISKILHIATSTTYKHIAHIYEKMHVSSRQELLVKLLN